jgi:hypothetical protein
VCLKLFSLQFYLQVSTPNVFLINFEDGKSFFLFLQMEEENLFGKLFTKSSSNLSLQPLKEEEIFSCSFLDIFIVEHYYFSL